MKTAALMLLLASTGDNLFDALAVSNYATTALDVHSTVRGIRRGYAESNPLVNAFIAKRDPAPVRRWVSGLAVAWGINHVTAKLHKRSGNWRVLAWGIRVGSIVGSTWGAVSNYRKGDQK